MQTYSYCQIKCPNRTDPATDIPPRYTADGPGDLRRPNGVTGAPPSPGGGGGALNRLVSRYAAVVDN